ncbi:MAG TPA: ParB/RepB/Spo0J family partition protein [Azospirillaceae bacterium]|nr:ParB/RepB/Spo0J family partition protein [Azospirillaceae bacterium]
MAGKSLRDRLANQAGAIGARLEAKSEGLVKAGDRHRHSFEVPLDAVRPDPTQPRKHFDAAALSALAETMRQQGQLQPIGVRRDPADRSSWIIAYGERRWRAARQLGWDSLAVVEVSGDHRALALIENLQRQDLTAVEEARGLADLMEAEGLSQTAAAAMFGRTQGAISQTLALLNLHADILQALGAGEADVPRRTLYELAKLPDEEQLRLWPGVRAGLLDREAVKAAPAPARQKSRAGRKPDLARGLGAVEKTVQAWHRQRPELDRAARERLERLRHLLDDLLKG